MSTVADEIWEILRGIAQSQKETDREIKAVNASIGRLTNRLGEFVEEAVRTPCCSEIV